MVVGNALVDGLDQGADIGLPMGISGLGKLLRGIH